MAGGVELEKRANGTRHLSDIFSSQTQNGRQRELNTGKKGEFKIKMIVIAALSRKDECAS